jgi:hypothetical protein
MFSSQLISLFFSFKELEAVLVTMVFKPYNTNNTNCGLVLVLQAFEQESTEKASESSSLSPMLS